MTTKEDTDTHVNSATFSEKGTAAADEEIQDKLQTLDIQSAKEDDEELDSEEVDNQDENGLYEIESLCMNCHENVSYISQLPQTVD